MENIGREKEEKRKVDIERRERQGGGKYTYVFTLCEVFTDGIGSIKVEELNLPMIKVVFYRFHADNKFCKKEMYEASTETEHTCNPVSLVQFS